MKKLKALVILAILAVVLLAGCSFDGSTLVGTVWEFSALGTGVGLSFDTATEGTEYVIAAGITLDESGFTYTYDAATGTGEIVYDGYTATYVFEITDNELDHELYPGAPFEYKPLGRGVE